MNQKAYHRNKISIDSVILTKSKLIVLVTIVFLFTATVSFAQDNYGENVQKISVDCTKEKSIHKTILPNTEKVVIYFSPCICEQGDRPVFMQTEIEKIGTRGGYRDFEAFWREWNKPTLFFTTMLPGESKDNTFQCWTKEQLKAYYDELIKFSGKPKD